MSGYYQSASTWCKSCGSYQFNLHQKGIDQGDLCDVCYWKKRALNGEEVAKFAWNYHLAVYSLAKAINIDDSEETIERFKLSLSEAFHAMDKAISELNKFSHNS